MLFISCIEVSDKNACYPLCHNIVINDAGYQLCPR